MKHAIVAELYQVGATLPGKCKDSGRDYTAV